MILGSKISPRIGPGHALTTNYKKYGDHTYELLSGS